MTGLATPTPAVGVVDVALATSQSDTRQAVDVLAQIWSADGIQPLSPELAWALLHAGNYVSLAHCDGVVVGAAVAFRGYDEDGPHLHSHIAGVLPAYQGGDIGFALKQHQRQWSLGRGIGRVTWTFDPLVARNAYFNVVKLGATIAAYYENFYGPLADDINAGDESDRCLASWALDRPRSTAVTTAAELRAQGAVEVLRVDDAGGPLVTTQPESALTLCQLPPDIVALRLTSPALAREWRLALRSLLGPALRDGAQVSTVTRDGFLVIARP
jgi:predicted GNAT superfamily acetyltransferase